MREDYSVLSQFIGRNFSTVEPLGCCEIAAKNVAGTLTEYECDQETYGMSNCSFEMMLNIPVNSYGHVRTFSPFYGTFTENCLKDNHQTKPIRLICVDGLT